MGRRGLSDLQPESVLGYVEIKFFHVWGMEFQILAHTQAKPRQSRVVFSLSSAIGVGCESFNLATLNRKT
jgi:hypothetical protein